MAYRNYSEAVSHIVDTNGQGDFTTIQSAITAASANSTIFIRPGTYTENLTLSVSVNLVAWPTDINGIVKVVGNMTLTAAGALNISGIQLQTNSAALITVSGSNLCGINLIDCYLNCTNNTGITFSNSNSGSSISFYNCLGDIGTTGIALFTHTSTGTLAFYNCDFTNGGGSSTASTASAGTLFSRRSAFSNPITTSSTNALTMTYSQIDTSAQNATCLTSGGSGSSNTYFCLFQSGSAVSVSVSANTLDFFSCTVNSTNTNAVSGAGTITFQNITFRGSSTTINTTTQTSCGTLQGSKQAASPPAGFLGEQMRSAIARGSAVAATTTTSTNITSINLTAGVWDISGVVAGFGMTTGTQFNGSVNTTSATIGTGGDNFVETPFSSTTSSDVMVSIPAWRQAFSATTTVYLVAQATYSVGTGSFYGRISATRVG